MIRFLVLAMTLFFAADAMAQVPGPSTASCKATPLWILKAIQNTTILT